MNEKEASSMNNEISDQQNSSDSSKEQALLHCPVRGKLNSAALAKDGLTPTEEARRIDFINYLLTRKYPKKNISVETVVLKGLGEKGRNKLRADVIVFDMPVTKARLLSQNEHISHALLVAEIKRDSSKKVSGITCQLEPAMRQLPGMKVLGVYWDDINRILFTKRLVKKGGDTFLEINHDNLANLPPYGIKYKVKPITVDTLTPPENLVKTLFNLANIMRSHGVNDEHLRYKETVKLILARYCDEKAAAELPDKEVGLQVYSGGDPDFRNRVDGIYITASKRYSRAKTLFKPFPTSELDNDTLADIVKVVQGVNFSSASSETMQQVFMSFVPTVFKKNLNQYFTPITLIRAMVEMTRIGPNEKIADPAMGTADFLTAAMDYRTQANDTDIIQRVFGIDSDPKAFELAIINMILNRDGQANLLNTDSIVNHDLWSEEMGVALCNPPFGARTLERRAEVLEHYDLGHLWNYDSSKSKWVKTEAIQQYQQIGILFIERCWQLLANGGRIAIILPEGYLCTTTYGYVRQWILDHFRILSFVELPRRIFLKSEADLRSNVFVGKKLTKKELSQAKIKNYPIHCELVRDVGYKLGKGYQEIPKRDQVTGLELRDSQNRLMLESDFERVRTSFATFLSKFESGNISNWTEARYKDIESHMNLDMKPRRLMPKALENIRKIKSNAHIELGDIAYVVEDTIDLLEDVGREEYRCLVEGQDIRAIEGTVIPQEPIRCWQIVERKSKNAYCLQHKDIIVGLVRPERRNIGLLLSNRNDVVGTPDGIAVVRIKPNMIESYPVDWLFAMLRSEECRLQFWTESGGTSYGKLTREQIRKVLIPEQKPELRQTIAKKVAAWGKNIEKALNVWETIGTENDRKPILNSPLFGLVSEDNG